MRKRTRSCLLLFVAWLAACAPAAQPAVPDAEAPSADLAGIKTYLLGKIEELSASRARLKAVADSCYASAEAADFDFAALWASQPRAGRRLRAGRP